ncbi:MAG: Wadjet anti-phage system protein JetA family protein, partial [Candidatus Izemoplasmatales bacterium]
IRSIVEHSEIKDLIHLLVNYKVELVDQAYYRLKTSDNINKYKLNIISKLENYQQDPFIIETIAREYLPKSKNNMELAKVKVNKKIDDMIDIYNALDSIIDEIDEKNKVYVNSTIAKIKFLLNDDENIIGKLTTILKHTAKEMKLYHTDSALKTINPLFNIRTHAVIGESSIFTPRGAYARSNAQFLVENDLTPSVELQEAFYKEFETNYSEDVIKKYLLNIFMAKNKVRASELLHKDMSEEAVLRLLYILVYAGDEMNYFINPLEDKIDHDRFLMEDFEIVRRNEQ